jgi:DNA-binding NarL/FixJ family response regulator
MYGEEQYGIRALKAGAAGYLKKVSAPDELVNAIRKIVSGGRYVSSSLGESLAKSIVTNSDKLPHEILSDREYNVMCRIASGETAENISLSLSISIHTFYSYRNRILEKMKMKSNVELTQYVLNNKLIQ